MAPPFFSGPGKKLARNFVATGKAIVRTHRAIRRIEASEHRADTREWVMERRKRTRHLIELGGLIQKAGLVDLTDDDRATLYGALLELATQVHNDAAVLTLWKRRGRRAFDAEAISLPTNSPIGLSFRRGSEQ